MAQLGDFVVPGVALFLAFSPTGRAAVKTLLPDLFRGQTGGENVGGALGGGFGGQVPSTDAFRLTQVGFDRFGVLASLPVKTGDALTVIGYLTHRGPGGQFIFGVDLCTSWPGCWLGLGDKPQPFQTIEQPMQIGADNGFQQYASSFSATYQGAGAGVVAARWYIRGADGTLYDQRWTCSEFTAV